MVIVTWTQAVANMTSCERVYVRTPTGPGGMSGPLRCLHILTLMLCYVANTACQLINGTAATMQTESRRLLHLRPGPQPYP